MTSRQRDSNRAKSPRRSAQGREARGASKLEIYTEVIKIRNKVFYTTRLFNCGAYRSCWLIGFWLISRPVHSEKE